MKKILTMLITLALLVTPLSITSAYAPHDSERDETQEVYTYEVDGITVTGNVELTEEELNNLLEIAEQVTNDEVEDGKSINGGFGTQSIDGGGNGGTIVHGPVYTEVRSYAVREVADLIAAWMLNRTPIKKVTKSTLGNYTASKLTGWTDNLVLKAYVGYWNWESYNGPYEGCRYRYQTLVRYSDSSYSNMVSVDYYQIGMACY